MSEGKAELRWALANWGKIPGNPTIYLEWKNEDAAPDHFEGKLLLGGAIASGWHWGSNFVWEHELGGRCAGTLDRRRAEQSGEVRRHGRLDGHIEHAAVDRVLRRDDGHAPRTGRIPVLRRFRVRGIEGAGRIPRQIDDTRQRGGIRCALHADEVELQPADVDPDAHDPKEHRHEESGHDDRLPAIVVNESH